jgi:cation diffusion facilitator family transporter
MVHSPLGPSDMRTQVIVWATVGLNAVLFLLNISVALVSGSAAVLSQAVYALADLVGSLLLMWGAIASQRPPDYEHPFGFGKERFFWSFSASLVTFTIAGLLVLTDGIRQVAAPHPINDVSEALLVLGATLALSAVGIWVTLREVRRARQAISEFLESSRIGLKTIFYQDVVSVVGSVLAFGGVAVVQATGDDVADGVVASIVGILMILTGIVLAAESRELLIGKAVSPEQARAVLAIVERDAQVRKVRSLQSMMLGPDDVLVALRINFEDGLDTDQIERVIDRVNAAVRTAYPAVRHLIIEPES